MCLCSLIFGTTSTLFILPDSISQQFPSFHSTTAKLNIFLMRYVDMLPLPHRTVHRLWPSELVYYSLGKPTLGCLWPWLAEASLTALKKKDSGVCPISIGEVFSSLSYSSKIFCFALCSHFVDPLILYGQWVKGGLETAIHATCCCL